MYLKLQLQPNDDEIILKIFDIFDKLIIQLCKWIDGTYDFVL